MAKIKVGKTVASLGEYLREQRVAAELSLRQLAEQTGVSNPYLSQIERGLRRPSAEVLQQLAKALRISAEQLYVQAGILNPDDGQVRSVELAILGDPVLSERQKQSLLDVYQSFRAVAENCTTHRSTRARPPSSDRRARDNHSKEIDMAKTQFNVDQLKAEAVKPLYAVAGATEIAYEFARGYAAEAQKTAAERFSRRADRASARSSATRRPCRTRPSRW